MADRGRGRKGRRPGRSATALALLAALASPPLVAGEEASGVTPARIEAAFLRNFAHYVSWPSSAFADERAAWRVCILGGDPFGDTLEGTLRGRTEQGRMFTILRAESPAETRRCQIVYVAYRDSESRRAALAELANLPVLTVGDARGFLQEGGIIRFEVSDRVEFAVNLDRANSASLRIPSKVLEVAQGVLENGVLRRRP